MAMETVIKRFGNSSWRVWTFTFSLQPGIMKMKYSDSPSNSSLNQETVLFLKSTNVTTYSKFVFCVDKSVDIELCTCAKEQNSYVIKKGVLFENG